MINNKRLNKVIDDYIEARDYCYTHTNKFNIPYSILYTREAIDIFGQKVADCGIGNKIHEAIQNNCKYFQITNGQIQKNISDYVTLNLVVVNHRLQGSRQYMTIKIEEQDQIVFEEDIEMVQYAY